MPLDPDAKRLLNLLGAVGGGLAIHSTPAHRRQAFKTLTLSVAGDRVAVDAVQNTSFPGPGDRSRCGSIHRWPRKPLCRPA
jgi:hypothetical protein